MLILPPIETTPILVLRFTNKSSKHLIELVKERLELGGIIVLSPDSIPLNSSSSSVTATTTKKKTSDNNHPTENKINTSININGINKDDNRTSTKDCDDDDDEEEDTLDDPDTMNHKNDTSQSQRSNVVESFFDPILLLTTTQKKLEHIAEQIGFMKITNDTYTMEYFTIQEKERFCFLHHHHHNNNNNKNQQQQKNHWWKVPMQLSSSTLHHHHHHHDNNGQENHHDPSPPTNSSPLLSTTAVHHHTHDNEMYEPIRDQYGLFTYNDWTLFLYRLLDDITVLPDKKQYKKTKRNNKKKKKQDDDKDHDDFSSSSTTSSSSFYEIRETSTRPTELSTLLRVQYNADFYTHHEIDYSDHSSSSSSSSSSSDSENDSNSDNSDIENDNNKEEMTLYKNNNNNIKDDANDEEKVKDEENDKDEQQQQKRRIRRHELRQNRRSQYRTMYQTIQSNHQYDNVHNNINFNINNMTTDPNKDNKRSMLLLSTKGGGGGGNAHSSARFGTRNLSHGEQRCKCLWHVLKTYELIDSEIIALHNPFIKYHILRTSFFHLPKSNSLFNSQQQQQQDSHDNSKLSSSKTTTITSSYQQQQQLEEIVEQQQSTLAANNATPRAKLQFVTKNLIMLLAVWASSSNSTNSSNSNIASSSSPPQPTTATTTATMDDDNENDENDNNGKDSAHSRKENTILKKSKRDRKLLYSMKFILLYVPLWLQHWVYRIIRYEKKKLEIPYSFIIQIQEYYGNEVAYYFAWLDHITRWLHYPGYCGIIVYILRYIRDDTLYHDELTPFYGLITFFWGMLLLKYWNRTEIRFAYLFGTLRLTAATPALNNGGGNSINLLEGSMNHHHHQSHHNRFYYNYNEIRNEFYGTIRKSPITNQYEIYYSPTKRRLKYCISVVITMMMLYIAFVVMCISLNLQGMIQPTIMMIQSNQEQELMSDLDGNTCSATTTGNGTCSSSSSTSNDYIHPFYYPQFAKFSEKDQFFDTTSSIRCLLPVILHAIGIYILNQCYRYVATILTNYENHVTYWEYNNSMIWKRFLFEAFDCYMILFYLAFYERDVNKVQKELIAVFQVDAIRRMCSETILPLFLHEYHDQEQQQNFVNKHKNHLRSTRSSRFLSPIRLFFHSIWMIHCLIGNTLYALLDDAWNFFRHKDVIANIEQKQKPQQDTKIPLLSESLQGNDGGRATNPSSTTTTSSNNHRASTGNQTANIISASSLYSSSSCSNSNNNNGTGNLLLLSPTIESIIDDIHGCEVYEPFDDYMEMIIQLGYVTLFASAYPLASFISIIANYIEIRSDLFKLTNVHRKVRPYHSTNGVGVWKKILGTVLWTSAITNCFIAGYTSEQLYHYLPKSYHDRRPNNNNNNKNDNVHISVGLTSSYNSNHPNLHNQTQQQQLNEKEGSQILNDITMTPKTSTQRHLFDRLLFFRRGNKKRNNSLTNRDHKNTNHPNAKDRVTVPNRQQQQQSSHDKGWYVLLLIFALERFLLLGGYMIQVLIPSIPEDMNTELARRSYLQQQHQLHRYRLQQRERRLRQKDKNEKIRKKK